MWIANGVEEYRKSRRPDQIFLIRHAESRGNVNETLYSVIPDHLMELTDTGRAQAKAAGRKLKELVGDGPVFCFMSPYLRAFQTLVEMRKAFSNPQQFTVREDPLLREQEFGNFQDVDRIKVSKTERRRYGRFWYRFDNGESGADVHGRAADFLLTLYRQMDLSHPRGRRSRHYVILTHGLFIRLFAMRYMGWTVAQFEQVWNPSNCEIWQLDRQPDGRYYLSKAYRARHKDGEGDVPADSEHPQVRIAQHECRTMPLARSHTPRLARSQFELVEAPLLYGANRGAEIPERMRRPRSSTPMLTGNGS